MKKKVIALLRVSGAAQAASDREGLPVQRDDCLALAAAHNLDIVEWIELDGVSGAAVLSDARFQGLLSRLREPQISGVVVGAFDRLFRRGRFSDYAILDAFVDARATLYTPQGLYDLEADSDALLGVIHSELSAAERRNIARRTRAGRERKRREHGVRAEGPVGLPRGVLYSKEAGWRYDWPEAERVREVFALFLGGTTNLAEIARCVGIAHKGQSNSESWAIRSILTQPLYKGLYRVDKRWIGGGKWVPRDPQDCYEHVVISPPLISSGDWARAQELLSALRGTRPRLPSPEDRPLDYLGHLICAGCGGPLSSRREKGGLWSYICARSYKSAEQPGACRTFRQLAGVLVDPLISNLLERVLGDVDILTSLVEARLAESKVGLAGAGEIEGKLAKLENRRRRALDLYEMGVIDGGELRKRVEIIDDEARLLRASQGQGAPVELDENALLDLARVFSSWSVLRREERRELLSSYQIRLGVEREGSPKNYRPVAAWIEIGAIDGCRVDVGTYKKMKRLGIE